MVLKHNLRCVKCGYNLRGLADDGKCPECSLLIRRTLQQPPRRSFWLWTTLIVFAIFHILIVSIPVLLSQGSGEGQAFAVALFDFPIVALLKRVPGGSDVLYGMAHDKYIFIFSVIGTLMYAMVGGFVGYLIDVLRFGLARRRALK